MKDVKRQAIGIDVAKLDFAVCFSVCNENRENKHLSTRKFQNNPTGFKDFILWVTKWFNKDLPLSIAMEATGVYHERLACFILDSGLNVSVLLPKRAKDFSRTLNVKATNDKISSQYLAIMGLEKNLELWKKPEKVYVQLRRLTRERAQIIRLRTQVKNQMHAEKSGAWPDEKAIKRLEAQIALLKAQEKEIMTDIMAVLDENPIVKERVLKITSIPGVGLLTVCTIIGEANGFQHFRNKRQLVSYSGYDVMQNQSGTSVNTKARMSKRGNKHMRRGMHLPALTAIRHNENDKNTFIRIVSRTGIKMKGVVAVQRKLLVLIYTLWKNGSTYDPKFEENKKGQSMTAPH